MTQKMTKKNETTKLNDIKISVSLMSSFVILTLQYFILIYFDFLDSSSESIIQLISKIIVGFFFLYALPAVLQRSRIKMISIYFIAIFIFLLHILLFQGNREYIINIIPSFFLMCIPAFVYAISINDLLVLKKTMKKSSYIILAIGVSLAIYIVSGRGTIGNYSMSLSYYMILPTIMFLDELFDRYSLKAVIFVMLSVVIILALGSRGALLCVFVFTILKLLKNVKNLSYKNLLVYSSLVIIGIFLIIYLNEFLLFLNNLLLELGITSRTLALYFEEGVSLSGRENLYNTIISGIKDKPVTGIGIGGDRLLLEGSYAHNIFLEVLTNFGLLFGGFLCIFLISIILSTLRIKSLNKYNMSITWLSLGFIPLLVSNSYLLNLNFWIYLGIIINILCRKNYTDLKSDE